MGNEVILIQNQLIGEFNEFEDEFDRYTYLMELGKITRPFPPEMKDDEHLVAGCQAQVWVSIEVKDDKVYFLADTETMIIKGILYLIETAIYGQNKNDVKEAGFDFLYKCKALQALSDMRQKGIGYIVGMIVEAIDA